MKSGLEYTDGMAEMKVGALSERAHCEYECGEQLISTHTSSAIYRHMMILPLRVHRVGEFQYNTVYHCKCSHPSTAPRLTVQCTAVQIPNIYRGTLRTGSVLPVYRVLLVQGF